MCTRSHAAFAFIQSEVGAENQQPHMHAGTEQCQIQVTLCYLIVIQVNMSGYVAKFTLVW